MNLFKRVLLDHNDNVEHLKPELHTRVRAGFDQIATCTNAQECETTQNVQKCAVHWMMRAVFS